MVNPGTALTLEQIALVHEEISKGEWVAAANMVKYALGQEPDVTVKKEAEKIIRLLFNAMMDVNNYRGAAALCLPKLMFNPDPEAARRLFKAACEKPLLLSMGSSSMSKTYSLVVHVYLSWLRDPKFTSVKLMSQTDLHLRTNLWPHLLEIHKNNVLKPEQEVEIKPTDLWMGLKNEPQSYGFSGMAFKNTNISAGAWAGLKPQPKRPRTDPYFEQFGPMTRLRVLMDEAQNMPESVWIDMNSVMGSIGHGRVHIMAAFNPQNLSQPAVVRAEPPDGWSPDQLETLYSYESKYGWWVERLDGKMCENVIQRKEIYPGLMTYERFVGYLKGGGDSSGTYYTYARGFPPMLEAANTVIVPTWASSQKGEAVYVGEVINVASFDAAYQGQDKAMLCVGRWGLASGWRDYKGVHHTFLNRLDPAKKQPRHVLTIDQFFTMPKQLDAVQVTQELMARCNMLGIEPQWVSMDMTGVSLATYSYCAKYWGPVLGVGWNTAASERKILTDDLDTCANRFDGLPSEMWFALKHWMDPSVNAILFNTTIMAPDLYGQMTSRRFRVSRGSRLKVEGKDEYKARNAGKSPDEVDAVCMLVQLLRVRGGVIPGIVEQTGQARSREYNKPIKYDSPDGTEDIDTGGKDSATSSLEIDAASRTDATSLE